MVVSRGATTLRKVVSTPERRITTPVRVVSELAYPPVSVLGSGALSAVDPVVARLRALTETAASDAAEFVKAAPRAVLVVAPGHERRPWAAAAVDALRHLDVVGRLAVGEATPDTVALLATVIADEAPDVVVAIGGGTVLDVAKAAAALACPVSPGPEGSASEGPPRASAGLDAAAVIARCTAGAPRPPAAAVPVVAVPTTAGTGAEITPFATIWDQQSGRKLSMAGPAVRPAACLLDPDLLVGLPNRVAAVGVLDTLCQGAEAAWSVRATAESTAHGLAAVTLAVGVLDDIAAGTELGPHARLQLLLAAHYSGLAIASARTSSCHALSYPLTLSLGLVHGHACGVTLARMLRFNAGVTDQDCALPGGAAQARLVVARIAAAAGFGDDAGAAAGLAGRVERFLTECGLATYDELPAQHRRIAAAALDYPQFADNPRRADLEILTALLDTPMPVSINGVLL